MSVNWKKKLLYNHSGIRWGVLPLRKSMYNTYIRLTAIVTAHLAICFIFSLLIFTCSSQCKKKEEGSERRNGRQKGASERKEREQKLWWLSLFEEWSFAHQTGLPPIFNLRTTCLAGSLSSSSFFLRPPSLPFFFRANACSFYFYFYGLWLLLLHTTYWRIIHKKWSAVCSYGSSELLALVNSYKWIFFLLFFL